VEGWVLLSLHGLLRVTIDLSGSGQAATFIWLFHPGRITVWGTGCNYAHLLSVLSGPTAAEYYLGY
jgi:hypothetical protein